MSTTSESKFKVGDIIILLDPEKTRLPTIPALSIATVMKVKPNCVYVSAEELSHGRLSDNEYGLFYILNDCCELFEVYNSPLYQALL